MTLEEKISQMMDKSTAIERLGIPAYNWGNECVHGVSANVGVATVFPQGIALAATWDPELLFKVTTAISDEARARFHAGLPDVGLTFWSPMVNLARDPRWGRTQEGYGEDPFLVSRLGVAFVKGLQGNNPKYLKAVSTPKHYAANNEEWCRHTGSAEVDEQMLREYYLPPYKALIQEGGAMSVMAAYNRLNGVPCCCNKELLTDILRGEWGFTGYVVSDCNGLQDIYQGHHFAATPKEAVAMSINAGLDLECGSLYATYMPEAIKDGLVSMVTLDRALASLLTIKFRLGLFDPPEMVPYSKIPMKVVDSKEHRELARQTSRESIVLLKNAGNFLPLDKKQFKSVAVIGPNANVVQLGDYTGKYSHAVTPLEGIQNKVGKDKVIYEKGCDINVILPTLPPECFVPPGATAGQQGLKGEYFNNHTLTGKPVLVRIDPKIDFDWDKGSPAEGIHADTFAVRWTGKFIAPSSKPFYIGGNFDDEARLYLDGKLIFSRMNTRNRASAIKLVNLEAGRAYDIRLEFLEHWYKSAMRLGGMEANPEQFRAATDVAKKAEAVIMVLGTDLDVEDEGVDRSDLNLPGVQEELVREVMKANPKSVGVLVNGSALSINWMNENVPAIIDAWFFGEEGGNAIADVLFGDYNPGGKLPLTFYKSVDQLPPMNDYDIRKGRTYLAEIRKGGSYQSAKDEPLYPFGYGLSYTQFSFSDLKVEPKVIGLDGKIQVSLNVKNTGQRTGDEVVQLYVRDVEASVARPVKELRGFQRGTLKPGETKAVTLTVPASNLSFWDVQKKAFVTEPGLFEVMVGSSSEDIKLRDSFSVK